MNTVEMAVQGETENDENDKKKELEVAEIMCGINTQKKYAD